MKRQRGEIARGHRARRRPRPGRSREHSPRSPGPQAAQARHVGGHAERVHGDHRPRAAGADRHHRVRIEIPVVRRRPRRSARRRGTGRALASATQEYAGTMTSSPRATPSAFKPRRRAARPDATPTACARPARRPSRALQRLHARAAGPLPAGDRLGRRARLGLAEGQPVVRTARCTAAPLIRQASVGEGETATGSGGSHGVFPHSAVIAELRRAQQSAEGSSATPPSPAR